MKCPNCGNELGEGHLICEVCGKEIQMVPDFEPEIENSITEVLSTMVVMEEDIPEEESIPAKQGDSPEDVPEEPFLEEHVSVYKRVVVMAILIVLFCIIAISYGMYRYHISTADYQLQQAKEAADNEDYEKAIAFLEKAYEKSPSDTSILFTEADYYYLLEDRTAALQVLMQVIGNESASYEEIESAYDKVITIYAKDGQYDKINDLLADCPYEQIVTIFQGYMAKEPSFSYEEGTYAEVIPLKLSSNTSGTIYYTMDGTLPDKNSPIYTAPIFLETGEYTISAMFINDYGIESDAVTKHYTIDLLIPTAPQVELYSGEYEEPTMIAVEGTEGCKVFYTTDESEPTADSVPYTGPIPMPLGKTIFKFVNISEEGIASEVTMRTYTLKLVGAIPTSRAVSNLVTRLVENGYLEDVAGHSTRQKGTFSYQFSSVIKVGKDGEYFTIYEYYDDGTGMLSRTDKVFLVEVYTGDVAQLGYDENGEFMAVPI